MFGFSMRLVANLNWQCWFSSRWCFLFKHTHTVHVGVMFASLRTVHLGVTTSLSVKHVPLRYMQSQFVVSLRKWKVQGLHTPLFSLLLNEFWVVWAARTLGLNQSIRGIQSATTTDFTCGPRKHFETSQVWGGGDLSCRRVLWTCSIRVNAPHVADSSLLHHSWFN